MNAGESDRLGASVADAGGGLFIRPVLPDDTAALVALWSACGLTRPWNDPHRDIERRRAIDDGLFLVGLADDNVGAADAGAAARGVDATSAARGVASGADATENATATASAVPIASAMGGYEGHRGWVNYLAVHPAHRGRGHARALMAELEGRLLARGCPKINLQVREGNAAALAFYTRLGFGVDRSVSLGKRLIPDD